MTKKASIIILFLILFVFGYIFATKSPRQVVTKAEVCKHPAPTPAPEPDFSRDFSGIGCQFSAPEPFTIRELDESSCKRISRYFIVDKKHVYKQLYDLGSSDYSQYTIVKEADPKTFRPLNHDYYRDNNRLFYDAGNNYKIIPNIDLSSLQVLSPHYLKDNKSIYYYQQNLIKVTGFDLSTFRVIQNQSNPETYFADKDSIYFGSPAAAYSKLDLADSISFQVLDAYLMAKDKNYVYRGGDIVEGADPNTFEILTRGYFKDKNSVYTTIGDFRKIPGRDGCSYELVDYSNEYDWSGYAKDKNKVYYREMVVEDADPATFKVENGQASDKNYSFQGIYKIKK